LEVGINEAIVIGVRKKGIRKGLILAGRNIKTFWYQIHNIIQGCTVADA